MARTRRKLRYTRKINFKARDETYAELKAVAEKKNVKLGKLVRSILEEWLWGYMNGPGKRSPPKPKNERLL